MKQYRILVLLAACVACVLVGCAKNTQKDRKKSTDEGIRFYCIETKEEFYISQEEMEKYQQTDAYRELKRKYECTTLHIVDYDPDTPPLNNGKTWVAMTLCPNCKKYFVPEYLKEPKEGEPLSPPPTDLGLICPYCKTDLVRWYRERRQAATQPSKSPA